MTGCARRGGGGQLPAGESWPLRPPPLPSAPRRLGRTRPARRPTMFGRKACTRVYTISVLAALRPLSIVSRRSQRWRIWGTGGLGVVCVCVCVREGGGGLGRCHVAATRVVVAGGATWRAEGNGQRQRRWRASCATVEYTGKLAALPPSAAPPQAWRAPQAVGRTLRLLRLHPQGQLPLPPPLPLHPSPLPHHQPPALRRQRRRQRVQGAGCRPHPEIRTGRPLLHRPGPGPRPRPRPQPPALQPARCATAAGAARTAATSAGRRGCGTRQSETAGRTGGRVGGRADGMGRGAWEGGHGCCLGRPPASGSTCTSPVAPP